MSNDEMMAAEQDQISSPVRVARAAGNFQLVEGATAAFGHLYLVKNFGSATDAATAADWVLANQPMFQVGFAASVVAVAFHLMRALMMYELLKVVRLNYARIALLVIVAGCALQAVAAIFYIGIAYALNGGGMTLSPSSAPDIALLLYKLNIIAFNTYLIFFGIWNFLIGYLIWKSTFMPRPIGLLVMVTGLGWMLNVYPMLASQSQSLMMIASALGEIPLLLWLLVKGVNAEQWWKQANVNRVPTSAAKG